MHGRGLEFGQHPGSNGDANEVRITFIMIINKKNNQDLHGRGLEFGQHPGSNGDANEVQILVIIYFLNIKLDFVMLF